MRRGVFYAVTASAAVATAIAGLTASCTTFSGIELPPKRSEAGAPARPSEVEASLPPEDDGGPDGKVAVVPLAGYLSLADGARVCALAARCPELAPSVIESIAVPMDTLNFSSCVDWTAGALPQSHVGISLQAAQLGCAAKASTCVAAGACLSVEKLTLDDPRCPIKDAGRDVGALQRCDTNGTSVIRCNVPDILHCNSGYYAPGSTCLQASDGRSFCATDKNCVSTSCIGNVLEYCGGGLHESINCAASGYTCGLDTTVDGGYTDCLTGDRIKACPQAGTDCDGTVVAVCDGFNRSEFDCKALGGTCSKIGATARCTRPNDECTPFDANVNGCSGATITLCVGGKRTDFDCATVGMSCLPGNAQQSGRCG